MNIELNVSVVDDDPAVRKSICALLDSDGLTPRGFESAQAFLDAFSADDTGCLVVDVQMPSMNGLELQARLAVLGVDLPIIIITGHGDVPMAVD